MILTKSFYNIYIFDNKQLQEKYDNCNIYTQIFDIILFIFIQKKISSLYVMKRFYIYIYIIFFVIKIIFL